jgi:very-short-patch-repair endonuclease
VVSRTQLLALGYTAAAIKRRSAGGRLHRVHRGVHAVGHARLTLRARWLAAVLACGRNAVLSHLSAGALQDLIGTPSGAIDVTSPSRHNLPGIRCHSSRCPDPRDAAVTDAIPVTTVARTLLDLAAVLHAQRLRSAIEAAQRSDRFEIADLRALIGRATGHRGLKPINAALQELHDEAPWIQSQTERDFLELVRGARLPEPRTNVITDGWLVDAFWPEHNLVVEVDGWTYHRARRAFEDDRLKDAKLVLAGRRVVRFTYRRIQDAPGQVARELARLLSAGQPPARACR